MIKYLFVRNYATSDIMTVLSAATLRKELYLALGAEKTFFYSKGALGTAKQFRDVVMDYEKRAIGFLRGDDNVFPICVKRKAIGTWKCNPAVHNIFSFRVQSVA